MREQYPWFLSTYNSFEQPILQADSVRYLYMHAFGGRPLLFGPPQCKDLKVNFYIIVACGLLLLP